MLQQEYKNLVEGLKKATATKRLQWAKAVSVGGLHAKANAGSLIQIDKYSSRVGDNINWTVSIAVIELPSRKILDEVVVTDILSQIDDFHLLDGLYSAATKQYAESVVNPALVEITGALRSDKVR